MKKLSLIALAIGMVACDDKQMNDCDCSNILERKTLTLVNGVWQSSDWIEIEIQQHFTDDCLLNNQISNEQIQGNITQVPDLSVIFLTRNRIYCD